VALTIRLLLLNYHEQNFNQSWINGAQYKKAIKPEAIRRFKRI
jgi:hypothetical protein